MERNFSAERQIDHFIHQPGFSSRWPIPSLPSLSWSAQRTGRNRDECCRRERSLLGQAIHLEWSAAVLQRDGWSGTGEVLAMNRLTTLASQLNAGHKPVPDAHSVPASLHALDDASGPALRIHPQHTRYYGSCCSGAHVKHGRSASDNVTGCVLPNYPLWDRLRRRAHPPVARWSPCRATGSTTLRACLFQFIINQDHGQIYGALRIAFVFSMIRYVFNYISCCVNPQINRWKEVSQEDRYQTTVPGVPSQPSPVPSMLSPPITI